MFENLFRIAMEKFNNTIHCREAKEAAPHVIHTWVPKGQKGTKELRPSSVWGTNEGQNCIS